MAAGTAFHLLRSAQNTQIESSLAAHFTQWKAAYGKLYSTPAEQSYRLDIFRDQLALVQASNKAYEAKMAARGEVLTEPMFEMNKFGDLTEEEFLAMYTGAKKPTVEEIEETESAPSVPTSSIVPAPKLGQTDFVPRVRDQGNCGSCWAFASLAEIERVLYNQQNTYVAISPKNWLTV